MSQMTAVRAPRSTRLPSARSSSKPARLRVVQASDTRATGGVGFAVCCVLLLVGGLVGVLLLNTALAQQSFTLDRLEARSHVLTDQQQALAGDLQQESAPQQLALRAGALGMKPATRTRYVRASDGKVLGVAKGASQDAPFTVGTLPTTPASQAAGAATAAATEGVVKVEHSSSKKSKKESSKGRQDQPKADKRSKDSSTSKKTSTDPKAQGEKATSSATSHPKKNAKKSTR